MKIELTMQEMKMVDLLKPSTIPIDEPYERREKKMKISARLMHLLLDRQGIPKFRIKYFTQPKHNLASARKSRQ